MLGAADPGAEEEGGLAQALDWAEALGLDFRVPVTLERSESAAAEDLLNQRGYQRSDGLLRFARPAEPPAFSQPSAIEVIEVEEFTEGFSDYPGEGFDLDLTAWSFFDCLPGRDRWRCYFALDRLDRPSAAARNLIRAGFERVEVRPVWRPPPAEDEQDWGWEDDEDLDEPDEEDHDFDLEY